MSYELPAEKPYRFAFPVGAIGLPGVAADGLGAGVVACLVAAAAFVLAAGLAPAFAFVSTPAGVGVVTVPVRLEFAAGAGRAPLNSFGLSTTCFAR